MTTTPLNVDILQTNQYTMTLNSIPMASLFMQTFNLPSIGLSTIKQPTPFLDAYQVGEKLDYGIWECEFLVDKNLANYKEIYRWLHKIKVRGSSLDFMDQATVMVGDVATVKFVNVWPTSLSQMTFIANPDDSPMQKCVVTFSYDYWEFIE